MMPIFLVILGLLLIVSGIHGETKNLFSLLRGDFTGPANFTYWVVSIIFVGAIGYIKPLRPVSDAFLVLIVVVLFLKKGTGFFDQFTQAINSTQTVPAVDLNSNIGEMKPFNGVFNGHGASANW